MSEELKKDEEKKDLSKLKEEWMTRKNNLLFLVLLSALHPCLKWRNTYIGVH